MLSKFYLFVFVIGLFIIFSCDKEISISPPDAPPPAGSFFIQTLPDSFKIYVDGKDRLRLTPDSIRWLETGTYQVTLKKDLFLDTAFSVDVTDGIKTEVFINILENPKFRGSLYVDSYPPQAEVFLNNETTKQITPTTILNLVPGRYKVTLKKENYSDNIFYQEVSSSKTSESKAALIDTTAWEYYNTENSEIPVDNLTSITIDAEDNIWLGSRKGLLNFDGSRWTSITPGAIALPHMVVNLVQMDEKNRLWVITVGGIALFQNGNIIQKFTSTGNMTSYATNFGTDSIDAVLTMQGAPYYFATKNGLGSLVSTQDMEFELDKTPAFINQITALAKLNNNTLVVGTSRSGIVMNTGAGKWTAFNRSNSNIPENSISAMYGSDEGVWIGHLPGAATSGGLSLFNGSTFQVYLLNSPAPKITAIYVDKLGYKWIGTDVGLFTFYNFDDKKLLNFDNVGLPLINIIGIDEDSKGNIWFATKENGLFKLKKHL